MDVHLRAEEPHCDELDAVTSSAEAMKMVVSG